MKGLNEKSHAKKRGESPKKEKENASFHFRFVIERNVTLGRGGTHEESSNMKFDEMEPCEKDAFLTGSNKKWKEP